VIRPIVVLASAMVLAGCARLPLGARHSAAQAAERRALLPRVPRDAPRFEIDSVTDSTAIFRLQEARWVRAGMAGYAVDPARRDAMVARLLIVSRDGESATALVTSQVARVRSDHFLLVVRPEAPWWHARRFWAGAVTGTLVGAGSALLLR
jgi:hypothetical protein